MAKSFTSPAFTKHALFILLMLLSGAVHAQYCVPDYATGCTSDDDINTFVLYGINGTAIVDSNTGCSVKAYDNRTSESVTMAAGGSYPGFVDTRVLSPDVENIQVFIDFNNDASFGSNESVGGVNSIAAASGKSFTLTMPAAAASGSHRMRVVMSFDSTYPNISPCPVYFNGFNYGEVHDYTAVIGTVVTCNAPASLSATSVTNKSATISWPAVTGSTGYEYAVITSATAPASGTATTSLSASVTGLAAATNYHAYVRNKCSAGNYSAWKTIAFTTTTATGVATTQVTGVPLVSIAPNPVRNLLRLTLNEKSYSDVAISLSDFTGKLLLAKHSHTREDALDMTEYAPGIYFLKVTDGNDSQILKVIRQ